jgi:glycosyltransferase involved in cell wall biosynthesis
MRICHVIQSLDPIHGGPTTVAARVCAATAALGHEVTLIGGVDAPQRARAEQAFAPVPGIERVRVDLVDLADRRGRVLGEPLVAAFERVAAPDVVHLHGVWEAALVRIAARCRRREIPYVVRPCGMLDFWSLRQKAWKKKLALHTSHRAYLRRAAALHTLNRHEREAVEALRLGVPVHVIPNGVFLEEVARETRPRLFRESQPGLGERPFLLFLSRLHVKKGLDVLAEAWTRVAPRLPGHALVVAGPREDDSIDAFRRRIAAAGLAASVLETGALFGEQKTAALRECDLFVLPSRQEGFSLAITEALALGKPVVISEECHFPEVADRHAGEVVPLAPERIAEALARWLGDAGMRSAAGARGAALIRERFTWPAIAAQCVALYESAGARSTTVLQEAVARRPG